MDVNVPLTESELEEWQALCDAANPEPWEGPFLAGTNATWADHRFANGSRTIMPRLIAEVRRLGSSLEVFNVNNKALKEQLASRLIKEAAQELREEDVSAYYAAKCKAESRAEAAEAKLAAANAMAVEAERQRDKLAHRLMEDNTSFDCGHEFPEGFQPSFEPETDTDAIRIWLEYAAQKDATE